MGSGQFKQGLDAPAPTEQNDNLGKDINPAICNATFLGSRFQILAENIDEDIMADCAPDNKEDDLDDATAAAQDHLIGEHMETVAINNSTADLGNNIVNVPCIETMCNVRTTLALRNTKNFPKPPTTWKPPM